MGSLFDNPYAPPKRDRDGPPEAKAALPRTYGTFVACAIVFVLDTVIMNQGAVAILTSLVLLVVVLARGFRRPMFAFKLVAVLALAPAVLGTNHLQNKLARHRAEHLIGAVYAYRADHDAYPQALTDLVPQYLPSIPVAKYTMSGEFEYFRSEEGATLYYVDLPPFGRPTYNFERKRWNYLD